MEKPPLTIQEKKDSRFDRFLRILKKGVIVSMIGLATSQAAESRLGTYIGHLKETRIERIIDKDKERKPVTAQELRVMVMQDESERIFVGTDNGLYEVGGGEKESGFTKFEDIQRFVDEGEKDPVVAHTHPISVFDNAGYTTKELNEMRARGDSLVSMPPSITDIMGSVSSAEHFKDQDIEIRNRVYDPTGMWEYTLQQDNSAIELFKKFQHDLNERIEASLTDTDKQIMNKLGVNKIHPAKRIAVLKTNQDTLAIGEKLEQTANQFMEELSEDTMETLSKFGELEYLCLNIAGAKKSGHNQKQTRELIKNYTETASSVGIQISYTPR